MNLAGRNHVDGSVNSPTRQIALKVLYEGAFEFLMHSEGILSRFGHTLAGRSPRGTGRIWMSPTLVTYTTARCKRFKRELDYQRQSENMIRKPATNLTTPKVGTVRLPRQVPPGGFIDFARTSNTCFGGSVDSCQVPTRCLYFSRMRRRGVLLSGTLASEGFFSPPCTFCIFFCSISARCKHQFTALSSLPMLDHDHPYPH